MQNWKKLGLIYNNQRYCSVPVGHIISANIIRIFFSTRDLKNQSIPFYFDYNLDTLSVQSENHINLDLGNKGTFDENGIMPTSLIRFQSVTYLYYIGWNKGVTVPFRNAIGLAISNDNGKSFKKYSEGPILDRSIYDNCFVASNCICQEESFMRMYYLSCGKWELNSKNVLQHSYNIKYAESTDGIYWQRNGKIIIDFKYPGEYAISVPRVLKEENIYKMWYSFRAGPKSENYRIGYAESANGIDWERKDEEVGLDVSENGWESEMICYPFIFDHKEKRYMLYNGNGYGKTGIGLAVLQNN